MKKILFLVVFFISLESLAEEEKFSLNCKLLDQNIFKLEDGKSEKFTGVDSVISKEIGDAFSVKFSYETYPPVRINEGPFFALYITLDELGINVGNILNFLFGSSTPGNYTENDKYEVSSDLISVWNERGTVKFSRYYKNDWQLSIFAQGGVLVEGYDRFYIGNANCIGMPDTYDKVLKSMQEINKIREKTYEQNNLK